MAFGVDDLIGAGLQIINKFIPDPALKAQAQQQFLQMQHQERMQLMGSTGEIIKAEAASSHWMAANWRPLTMLTFTGLIVARWFGLAAPELSPEEYIKLWDIVQLGLGGYMIGRSAEKIVPSIAEAMKK